MSFQIRHADPSDAEELTRLADAMSGALACREGAGKQYLGTGRVFLAPRELHQYLCRTAADLCASIGMTSTGLSKGTVSRLDPNSGSTTVGTCGTSSATSLVLNLGEAVTLREPIIAPITFVPSHF